jgi:hypothetical protein
VIIITGQGRSGTSLVASLYKELGFDPGGVWQGEVNAGFEDEDIVRANGDLIGELQVSMYSDRLTAERLRRRDPGIEQFGVGRVRRYIGAGFELLARRTLGRVGDDLNLVPWDQWERATEKYGPRFVELSRTHAVAKDPRFCWTLGAWAKAGAQIDHVLVCVRNIDAMVQSRMKAQHVMFRTPSAAKNSFIYGLGLCMTAIYDYRLPHDIVQFPDFLQDPERLYDVLRFPAPVDKAAFLEAFNRVARADLVHDRR